MTFSTTRKRVLIERIRVSRNALIVAFDDGRSLSLPIGWYPRLSHATDRERRTYRLVGNGHGAHWPLLDEDLSADGLLEGRRSGESRASLQRWLRARKSSNGRA